MNKFFVGELMVCVICSKMHLSKPNHVTHWRCVGLNEHRFYVCPREFADDNASEAEKEKKAARVLKHCKLITIGVTNN